MAMCGVTRAPFNSNRSSCGIEAVVPFYFYPKFERAQMCSVPIPLDSRKSMRSCKGIICDDISEFESFMPSHAVGLSQVRGKHFPAPTAPAAFDILNVSRN